jgi:RNA polymerase sigma-70 factor (ECF subfamily)
LAAYYLDERTLADIARTLRLHESSISRRLDRISTALRKRILAGLRERGMSHSQSTEALETDVRDLRLNLRSRFTQDSQSKSFPGGKASAKDAGRDGNHV